MDKSRRMNEINSAQDIINKCQQMVLVKITTLVGLKKLFNVKALVIKNQEERFFLLQKLSKVYEIFLVSRKYDI